MESDERSSRGTELLSPDDENDAASSEMASRQHATSASSQHVGAGNPALMHFLQPPGASPPLGANLTGMHQPQAFNQQIALNPFVRGFMSRPQGIGIDPLYLQQFLAARQTGNLMLAPTPNAASSLSTFPFQTAPLWTMDSLAQAPGSDQPQRDRPRPQQIQNALASIVAASGGSSGMPAMNSSTPFQGAQPVRSADRVSIGGRGPVAIYMDCDEEALSDYQCLLRKQIELFEATFDDVQWNAQGRNKAIVMGQVGIRCRHCSRLATWARARGAVYYSTTLDGLYQAAQNMAKNHLCKHCRLIPPEIKNQLLGLRDCKRRAAGGKTYWAEGARVLSVIESSNGLRFRNSKTGIVKATKDDAIKK